MTAPTRRTALAVALAGAVGAVAGCSSSSGGSSSSASGSAKGSGTPKGSGTVAVMYAGSLVDLMEKQLKGPFHTATGYSFEGFAGGSTALAAQIKGGVRKADVFVSASPKADKELMGSATGDKVHWYFTFATAPLVLGYNAKSSFAAAIKSTPWYDVITRKGFRVGRTDPKADPKGKLSDEALKNASAQHPGLQRILKDDKTVFPEEALVARLQSGQLDAGFFYSSEAAAASIPTVPLTGQSLAATYTVTVLSGAPNEAGAEAFVKFLLGPTGQGVLRKDGFKLSPPKLTGSGVPSSLASLATG